jgi:uncharacterized damage-inducible protein DinB
MLKAHFDELATYNRWANERLYDEAAKLPDEARKRPIGLFFSSLHGTLNHLLVTDYIWLRRMTGEGPQPERLNQILYDDFNELRVAREAENDRIFDFVTGLGPRDYDRVLEYRNSTGKLFQQQLASALTHLFNHQTHHRGQAHMILTGLPGKAPELDLLYYQRLVEKGQA